MEMPAPVARHDQNIVSNDTSDVHVANGHPPEEASKSELTAGSATQPPPAAQKRARPKKKGPNYAQIHSKPLPLEVHPLPAFHPSHPLSLLHLCYVYISHLLSPPSSHPPSRYTGYFSTETRSVHVTNPAHVRALWEMGFFGKGTLSRSEPSWLDREKARLKAERGGRGGGTAEEATNARREERRMFKLERARLEREKIERQRAVEEGRMSAEEAAALEAGVEVKDDGEASDTTRLLDGHDELPANGAPTAPDGLLKPPPDSGILAKEIEGRVPDAELLNPAHALLKESPLPSTVAPSMANPTSEPEPTNQEESDEADPDIKNQEHLQLTLEEAFFLSYGLGVLDIITIDQTVPPIYRVTSSSLDLLALFGQHTFFPPAALPTSTNPAPDNPFLLNYVVYHHFRSLGWVIRPGVKFGVDYMLYNRGPVFSHAEFGVLILPSYSHPYWRTPDGLEAKRLKKQKDWWWLHCVNRVQSQVRKSLVLCYVDVPPPSGRLGSDGGEGDIGTLLKRYKVREFVIRRWLANRSRD